MADDVDVDVDGGTGEPEPPQPATKTYTKAEVDAMLAKQNVRLRKEFADYPQLKVDSQELRALQDRSKSTEDRLRDEATKNLHRGDLLQSRYDAERIRTAVMAEAARQGATDPEDVAQLIDRSELIITDDGVEGAKEAVELLLAKKRYLVGGRRRAGVEFRSSERPGGTISRSQMRAWSHGEDGGWTPERIKQAEEAQKAGLIDANR